MRTSVRISRRDRQHWPYFCGEPTFFSFSFWRRKKWTLPIFIIYFPFWSNSLSFTLIYKYIHFFLVLICISLKIKWFLQKFNNLNCFSSYHLILPIFTSKFLFFLLIGKNGVLKSQKKALFLWTQLIWLAGVLMAKMWTQTSGVPHHLLPQRLTKQHFEMLLRKEIQDAVNNC